MSFMTRMELFEASVEFFNEQGHECYLRTDYSGRMMHGDVTPALIITPGPGFSVARAGASMMKVGLTVLAEQGPSELDRYEMYQWIDYLQTLIPRNTDQMGKGLVLY